MRFAIKPKQLLSWPPTAGARVLSLLIALVATLVSTTIVSATNANNVGQDNAQVGAESDPRSGTVVRVQLPIDSTVSSRVRQTLQEIAERAPAIAPAGGKPVVVLEFEVSSQSGRGSEIEACIALARYLGSPQLHRIHTVAYLPSEEPSIKRDGPTLLNGHAVLVAVAANQLALEPGTAIGAAGIDDKTVEPWVREVYRTVAQQRLTEVPVEIVLSMLDPGQGLHRVTKSDGGVVYVDSKRRDKEVSLS